MMDMGFMLQLEDLRSHSQQTAKPVVLCHLSIQSGPPRPRFLEFPIKVETPQSTPAKKVEQELYHVPNLRTKINFVERLLENTDEFNRVMIFARTKENADSVFKFVERKKLGPVRVIHSNKGQNSRINAMTEFKEGKLRVLVSTDVAARGIDVTGVSHVINFDVPILYEDYVHRIGRTGRADREGKAITLVTDSEEYHIDKIEKIIREKIPVKQLPADIPIEETPYEERQDMAREIDLQKRREDPEFKGAFHEKKGRG